MPLTVLRIACLLSALLLGAVSHAQFFGADRGGTIYRLDDAASYQEGCFDPCLCPLTAPVPVRGTFVMSRPVIGDVVDFREITRIDWRVGATGDTLHTIRGTGNYRVTNFGPPQQHALELELSIDGGESQLFFSDFVPVDANDGSIDIRVSMNGMFCYDIVIRVSAAPVPRDQIIPYRLAEGSTYQQGCFDPCDCILEEPVPLRGSFAMVKLLDQGTYAEYSVVNARFAVNHDTVAQVLHTYSGGGRYTLIQGVAGPAHALDLALYSAFGHQQLFDSGLQNTQPIFPAIDISVDMNDMVCFDRVLTLRARPPAQVAPMPWQDGHVSDAAIEHPR